MKNATALFPGPSCNSIRLYVTQEDNLNISMTGHPNKWSMNRKDLTLVNYIDIMWLINQLIHFKLYWRTIHYSLIKIGVGITLSILWDRDKKPILDFSSEAEIEIEGDKTCLNKTVLKESTQFSNSYNWLRQGETETAIQVLESRKSRNYKKSNIIRNREVRMTYVPYAIANFSKENKSIN